MKATERNKAILIMEVDSCLSCPLIRYNVKESFWYCSHRLSPESHLIKKSCKGVENFEKIEYELNQQLLREVEKNANKGSETGENNK